MALGLDCIEKAFCLFGLPISLGVDKAINISTNISLVDWEKRYDLILEMVTRISIQKSYTNIYTYILHIRSKVHIVINDQYLYFKFHIMCTCQIRVTTFLGFFYYLILN